MNSFISKTVLAIVTVGTLTLSTMSMAETEQETMHRVKTELTSYPMVNVAFNNGEVTLEGEVESQMEVERIKQLVMEVDGVTSVVSLITTQ